MTFRFLTVFTTLAAALIVLPACAGTPPAQAQAETPEPLSAREKLALEVTKPVGEAPEGYQPLFQQETVLKLNAIMRRSMAALEVLDRLNLLLPEVRQSGDAARIAEITKQLKAIEEQAVVAHTDFLAEKQALIAREEPYDGPTLAAMEYFVTEAPKEITATLANLGT
jgi:hypothetical protein